MVTCPSGSVPFEGTTAHPLLRENYCHTDGWVLRKAVGVNLSTDQDYEGLLAASTSMHDWTEVSQTAEAGGRFFEPATFTRPEIDYIVQTMGAGDAVGIDVHHPGRVFLSNSVFARTPGAGFDVQRLARIRNGFRPDHCPRELSVAACNALTDTIQRITADPASASQTTRVEDDFLGDLWRDVKEQFRYGIALTVRIVTVTVPLYSLFWKPLTFSAYSAALYAGRAFHQGPEDCRRELTPRQMLENALHLFFNGSWWFPFLGVKYHEGRRCTTEPPPVEAPEPAPEKRETSERQRAPLLGLYSRVLEQTIVPVASSMNRYVPHSGYVFFAGAAVALGAALISTSLIQRAPAFATPVMILSDENGRIVGMPNRPDPT